MVEHKYKTNLNCGRCVAAVKPLLDAYPAISRWSVDTNSPEKVLTVVGENVTDGDIARLVADGGFRVLGPLDRESSVSPLEMSAQMSAAPAGKNWLKTYWPLLLILMYLLGVVGLLEVMAGDFQWMRAMGTFMGGFFLVFSFFKLLDVQGFADAYQSYDLLARPWRGYGLAYPFIELLLGVAYLVGLAPVLTNAVTLVVMLLGIAGVAQALLRKQHIQCACLGTVFNLPMSRVTLIEDGVMAVMAALMLLGIFGAA